MNCVRVLSIGWFALWCGLGALPIAAADIASATKPNVLFIVIDDLNHWVGHLERNPQTITPNLDRLAGWGISFANAYAAAPACNPSRTALLSGMRPSTTGVYWSSDDQKLSVRPDQTLHSYFRANGYYTAGVGKIHHSYVRRDEWDEYGPPRSANRQGAFSETKVGDLRWAQLKGGDDAAGDYTTIGYCIDQLRRDHKKPLFLACGLFRPHLPWNVPKKYFDMHPLAEIQRPPQRQDDLDDLPPTGRRIALKFGDEKRLTKAGRTNEAIQAYLASITYADAQLGRLLDEFERLGYKKNTIVVLWGDHGWHLGEKQHWRKFTLWEEATRAPMIWVVPGVTKAGTISRRAVELISIYPTLCDLAGLPVPDHVETESLRPLLIDPEAVWERPALSTYLFGNHAVRSDDWRYIRYANGDEELYNVREDPYEWTNLAGESRYDQVKAELAKWFPTVNKPQVARRTPKAKKP